MKKISLLFAFVALFATASFAKESTKKALLKKTFTKEAAAKVSCMVHVKTGGYDVTIINSCDCTRRQACDGAYKIATLLL